MHLLPMALAAILALYPAVPADAADSRWEVTAYCAGSCCCGRWAIRNPGVTASGARVQEGVTVAVDPRVIPLGSLVMIEGLGTFIAQDTGSSVKGRVVDIYVHDHETAVQFGRQERHVWVITREQARLASRGGLRRRADIAYLLPDPFPAARWSVVGRAQ